MHVKSWSLVLLLLLLQSFFVVGAFHGGLRRNFEDYQASEAESPPHMLEQFAYVTWTKEKGYDIKVFATGGSETDETSIDWVARGRYQNLVNKTGWGTLEVESRPTWPDEMQMYAAGMLEGYLTRDLIFYFWQNMMEHFWYGKPTLRKLCEKFLEENQDWVRKSISRKKGTSAYWHHVNLFYKQVEGVGFGFEKASNGTAFQLSSSDILLINLVGDLGDLESTLDPKPHEDFEYTVNDGHCTALIKLIGNRDIYVSHVTWWRYESMLRILKRYNFPLRISSANDSTTVPGSSMSMSSYPGMVWSFDDFYTISSGLFVTETTTYNFNRDLWSKVTPQNSVSTGVRAMVANRLANDGREWSKWFKLYNSGTYNNQWLILNYGLFEPGKSLKEGLLWVLEQTPGFILSRDLTSVLNQTGYWASYNVPYFEDIYMMSETYKMEQKFGDFYSLRNSSRARIFARDHPKVHDIDTMIKLMRYNDYQHDPLSTCNCTPPYSAVNAISARCELNPKDGKYPFPAMGHRLKGATDMKLATFDSFLHQQFITIAGPTHDPLPPFRWSKSTVRNLPHYGMPDKYEFKPIMHQWKWI